MNLLGWLKYVHQDERGILPILGAIGAIGGLISGLKQGQAADTASAAQTKQADLMEKAQNYQFSRQAVTDPLFLLILRQSLARTQGAPRIFGRKRGVPLLAGLEGRTTGLPPARLIGSPEPVAPGATAPVPGAGPAVGLQPWEREILGGDR